MCDRASPGRLERIRMSRAWSPDMAWAVPTADLKSCSNFAWSVAVMNDSLMLGILLLVLAGGGGGICEELEETKELAI